MHHRFYVYLITSIVASSGLLFGFDTGVVAGALLFIHTSFEVTLFQQELIVSSLVVGAFIGACLGGQLADAMGRRKMLMSSSIGFIFGTLIIVFTPSLDFLILGRFILGLSIGICSFTAPLLIAEVAPANKRGKLVFLSIVTITGGQVIAYAINLWFAEVESWRSMFAMGLIPAVLLFIGVFFIPETPRWLVLKGRVNEAKNILFRIRGANNVDEELRAITDNIQSTKSSWREVFSRINRPALIIGLGLGIFQQISGINTVLYYGPSIFQQAGFADASSQIIVTMGMATINWLGTILAFFIIDKVGRRRLLIIGCFILALGHLFLFASFSGSDNQMLQILSVVGVGCFIAGYSISLGGIFWLIIAEIFPLAVRGLAMSLVTAIQWLANFVVALTFLDILNTLGPANTFGIFTGIGFLAFVFCYLKVPETKGVLLEDIHVAQQVSFVKNITK